MVQHPVFRIIVFVLLIFVGQALMTGILLLLGLQYGMDITEMQTILQEGGRDMPAELMRPMVWIQTVTTFVIPAIIFGLIFYRGKFNTYFKLDRTPTAMVLLLACVFMLTGYTFVQLAYELNQMIPLGDWAIDMEDTASSMMDEILLVDSPWHLITTLLIVAVLPGIGEELAFRGVLQKQIGEVFKSEHMGIWLSAMLFSAIHLQFEGFLPRMVLGAILGYLYYWTASLWVPIIVHFLNNGVQIVVLYASGIDLSEMDGAEATSTPWWGIIIAGIVMAVVGYRLYQQRPRES